MTIPDRSWWGGFAVGALVLDGTMMLLERPETPALRHADKLIAIVCIASYRGTPYVVLPNARFREAVTTGSADVQHLDRLFHGTWRAQLNGDLSRIGRYEYRKTYWRELSVNYVVDAVAMSCSDAR
jgi:hypothetical protein